MDYSTKVALGVKDCHLELDTQRFTEPIENQFDSVLSHKLPTLWATNA